MKITDAFITIVIAAISAAGVAFTVVRIMQQQVTVSGRLRVVDDAGRVRGQFKVFNDNTAYLTMQDTEGKEGIRLCIEPGGSSYMWLMQGNASASLGVGTARPYLRLKDVSGELMLTTGELNLNNTNGTHHLILRNVKMAE